jgi:hypothetical protein
MMSDLLSFDWQQQYVYVVCIRLISDLSSFDWQQQYVYVVYIRMMSDLSSFNWQQQYIYIVCIRMMSDLSSFNLQQQYVYVVCASYNLLTESRLMALCAWERLHACVFFLLFPAKACVRFFSSFFFCGRPFLSCYHRKENCD